MSEITTEELRRRYEAGERDFRGLDLSGIELFGTFVEADFSDVNFQCLEIDRCSFRGCDLSGADLTRSCLDNVNLGGAWLEDAILCDASLLYAKGELAILKGANFRGAKTSSDSRLYRNYFLRGAWLWNTILPDGDFVIGPDTTRRE